MQFCGEKRERERESERKKHREREKSDLIESLNLELPKVGYPNLQYKEVVSPSRGLAQ